MKDLQLSMSLSVRGGLQAALAQFNQLTAAEKELAVQAQKSASEQIAQQQRVREYLATLPKERRQLYLDAFKEQAIAEQNFTRLIQDEERKRLQIEKQFQKERSEFLRQFDRRAAQPTATRTPTPGASGGKQEGGFEVPTLQQAFYTLQNIKFIFDLIKGATETIGGALIGQNVTLEQQRQATAAVLSNTLAVTDASGKQLEGIEKIRALQAQAGAQQRELEKQSLEVAGATSNEIQNVLSIVNQQSQATGFGLKQNVNVATRFAQALNTYTVPLGQARQEVMSILNGTIDFNSVLAKSIGITNDQVKAERERGTLLEFILKKTEAAALANKEQARTIPGLTSNLQELFERFTRILGEPLTAALQEELAKLYDYVNSNKGAIEQFAEDWGPRLAAAFKLTVDVLQQIGTSLGTFVTGFFKQAQGIESATGVWGGALQALKIVIDAVGVAMGVISIDAATLGHLFDRLGIVTRNLFDPKAMTAQLKAADEAYADFVLSVDRNNKKLTKDLVENFSEGFGLGGKGILSQFAAEEKASREAAAKRKAADAASLAANTVSQAQTAEFQLAEFKRGKEAQTAAMSVELEKQKASLATGLASQRTTQIEANSLLFDIEQAGRQKRLAQIEQEYRLTVAAIGGKGKEALTLEAEAAKVRGEISTAIKTKLIADERETAQIAGGIGSSKLAALAAQKQLVDEQAKTATATADTANRQLQYEISLARFRGEYVRANNLSEELLIRQTRQLAEQTRLQSESNRLAAEMNRLQSENAILANGQKIIELERLGGREKEIANLREQNATLEKIIKNSTLLEVANKKNAQGSLEQKFLDQARAAQTIYAQEQVVELYRRELVAQKLTGDALEEAIRLFREKLRLAQEGGEAAGKEADEYGRAADNAGRLAENQARANSSRDSYSIGSGNKKLDVTYVDTRFDTARQAPSSSKEPRFNIPDYVPDIPGAATGAFVQRGGIIEVHPGELIAGPSSRTLAPLAAAIAPQLNNQISLNQGEVVAELQRLGQRMDRLAATAQPITYQVSSTGMGIADMERQRLQGFAEGAGR